MRRAAAWACVVAAVAAVAAAGILPWPAPVGPAADGLNAAFDSPELRWALPQAARFRALPWPSLVLTDARLITASGAELINAPETRLELSLGGLVKGEFRPIRAFLTTPVITLDLDNPFVSPWDMPGVVAKLQESLTPLDELRFENGVFRLRSHALGVDTEINALTGRLSGLSSGRGLRVDLAGVWRDAPVKMVGSFANPGEAAKGDASALNLAISAPPATAALSGALAGGENAGFAGDFTASVSSIAALRRLLGLGASHALAADDMTIGGKLKAAPDQATLSEATVSSAGQTLQGALQIAKGGARPILSGTLDAQQLAIAPIVGTLAAFVDSAGRWSAKPFRYRPPDLDVDLRLSAGALDLYGHALADAAASVIVKDGTLTASLLEASAYGGRLKGDLRLSCIETDLQLRAQLSVADADFGAALADFGWPVTTGKGGGAFAFETAGAAPADAIADLRGEASLKLKEGGIAGVNLEEALRKSQRRPIDVTRDMGAGGTAFDSLELAFAVGRGVAHVVHGELAAHGVAANLQGAVDLSARAWGLRVNAMQTDSSGGESQNAAHLTLDIGGPWSAPAVRVTSTLQSP